MVIFCEVFGSFLGFFWKFGGPDSPNGEFLGGFWKFFVNCSDRKLSVGQIVYRVKPSLIGDTLEGLKMGCHHSRCSSDPMDSHTG